MKKSMLLISLLLVGCASNSQATLIQETDEAATQEVSRESKLKELKTEYKKVMSDIESLELNNSCSHPKDCASVGIGHRPCGGPSDYRAYSKNNPDKSVQKLLYLAKQTNSLGGQINALNRVMGNCMFVPPPALVCEKNQCGTLQRSAF